jgi:transposase-like protein
MAKRDVSRRGYSRRAAEIYIDEGELVSALCERFGLQRHSVWQAVHRLREERGLPLPSNKWYR